MKLKSLLLGSAAALALSTGAQAADAMAEATIVSLDVCDAYGISGLTISSDDTCLQISGEVSYEYDVTYDDTTNVTDYDSNVDWELTFEATSETDAGPAKAVITLADDDDGDTIIDENEPEDDEDFFSEDPILDEAYVQFGDTTVISAGRKDTIFEVESDGDYFDWDDFGDNGFSGVDVGGHVIQVEHSLGNGFGVSGGFEDLEDDGGMDDGTGALAVGYSGSNVTANLGVVLGELYGDADAWNVYGDVLASYDAYSVFGAFVYNNDEASDDGEDYWAALLAGTADFEMFSLLAEVEFDENEDFQVGGELGFDATDTVGIYVGSVYNDGWDRTGEMLEVYGGVDFDITEALSANAEVGGEFVGDDLDDDRYYGSLGVDYTPGGNLEMGADATAYTDGNMEFGFDASKSF